ncbi:MAG: FtsX-like permease family protein [Woeseia sp.]
MSVLTRASVGYLLRHPWQLLTALAGICTGVAVIVSVDLATESSRRAFAMSMDAVNGEATHQIVAGPTGIDESLYVQLRVEEGLRNIAPVVEGYADVDNVTLHLLGVDPFAERDFRNYILPGAAVAAGGDASRAPEDEASAEDVLRRLLTQRGSVLLSRGTAASLRLSVGDPVTFLVGGRLKKGRLAGPLRASEQSGADNLVLTDISTAQQWLDMRGKLSRIDVRIPQRGQASGSEADRLSGILAPGVMLMTAAGRSESVAEMSEAFMTNLTAMSLLALMIGVFLIYNSVSFAVLQRRGLLGVLRALGVTRGQVFRLILSEALVLGIVGASLGLVAGVWLGEHLLLLVSRSINDLYFVVNVTGVVLPPSSVLVGLVAGTGATVAAAAVPALEAASYTPRLSLARSVLEQRSGRLAPAIALAGIAAAIASLVLLLLSGTSLLAGLIAVFMLIMGLALCVPLVVRAASAAGTSLAARAGMSTQLAVSGIGASLSRTGVAIVALAVAVSATVGVSIMVDSFRSSVAAWVDGSLRSDIYVGVGRGAIEADLVSKLVQLPQVVDHSSSRQVWLESGSGRIRLTATDMAGKGYAGTQLEQADTSAVWRAFREEDAVLASTSFTYRHGIQRGDFVSLPTTVSGNRKFRVAGTYRSFDADLDALLISRRTYQSYWDDPAISSLGLYLDEDARVDQVIERIRELSAGRQALIINSNRELREHSMQVFDRTFLITGVLYWLAVGVAAIGILAAMLALQLERARELAVFRALGMTPGQVGGMVTLQAALVGFLSGLAAIPLGLVMAWMLINVINRRAFGWQMDMISSPAVMLTALALATVAAVVAGLYPAWRAARANPAWAMREE